MLIGRAKTDNFQLTLHLGHTRITEPILNVYEVHPAH